MRTVSKDANMDCAWLDTALDTPGKRCGLLMPINSLFLVVEPLYVMIRNWIHKMRIALTKGYSDA